MLSGEKNKNIHESQSQIAFPGWILVTRGDSVSLRCLSLCLLKTQAPQSGGTWLLPTRAPCAVLCIHSSGGGFSATPWLSSFSVQLTGELGSKDSRKGKNCVQMALLKPLGRHYGGDQHYISHKSKPARDQGWLLRGPEPGTTMTESLTQNSSWPILH